MIINIPGPFRNAGPSIPVLLHKLACNVLAAHSASCAYAAVLECWRRPLPPVG